MQPEGAWVFWVGGWGKHKSPHPTRTDYSIRALNVRLILVVAAAAAVFVT